MTEEEDKIHKLNKTIVRNKKRIRNLEIRDNIIAFLPMFVLSGTVVAITVKNYDNPVIDEFSSSIFYMSLFIGSIPSIYLPTEKTKMKKEKYKKEIKYALEEIHTIAIEEDKKIMQNKK